eukprot:6974332-Pyramimonas_sp.AAC.1
MGSRALGAMFFDVAFLRCVGSHGRPAPKAAPRGLDDFDEGEVQREGRLEYPRISDELRFFNPAAFPR